MRKKVVAKQTNSTSCFVCGRENPASPKASFYELEDGTIAALVTCRPEHMSYPSTVHGGVTAALLDETLGRALLPVEPDIWGITLELNIKYIKTVPYDKQITVLSRITENKEKVFFASGEVVLESGEIAATATGVYFKATPERLSNMGLPQTGLMVYKEDSDPEYIEISDK